MKYQVLADVDTQDGKSWLEVGHYVTTKALKVQWRKAKHRYPYKDSLLRTSSEYRNGKRYWKILIPEDYTYTIIWQNSKHHRATMWQPSDWQDASIPVIEQASHIDLATHQQTVENYLQKLQNYEVLFAHQEDARKAGLFYDFMEDAYELIAQVTHLTTFLESEGLTLPPEEEQ